jgi:hypothetical protein
VSFVVRIQKINYPTKDLQKLNSRSIFLAKIITSSSQLQQSLVMFHQSILSMKQRQRINLKEERGIM